MLSDHKSIKYTYHAYQSSWNEEYKYYLEKFTIVSLSHLPSTIMFVHDLSSDCGTFVLDQVHVFS